MTLTELLLEWRMNGHKHVTYERLPQTCLPTSLAQEGCELIVGRTADNEEYAHHDFAWVLVKGYGQEVVLEFNHNPSLTELREVKV